MIELDSSSLSLPSLSEPAAMRCVPSCGVNLHHLVTFIAVAASGGVRCAAQSLPRGAPAVTRSVFLLERSLGVVLFERRHNGMLPTSAGLVLQARALRIEMALRLVCDDARCGNNAASPVPEMLEALFNERRLQVATLLGSMHHMPSVARLIGTSQPAVSQALAQLESALGTRLFTRTAPGMMPTKAGMRWLPAFDSALAESRHIRSDIAQFSAMPDRQAVG